MVLNKQQQEIIHHIIEHEKTYKYFSTCVIQRDILKGIRKDIDNLKDALKDQGVELE